MSDTQRLASPAAPVQAAPLESPTEQLLQPARSRVRIADLYRELPVIRVLAARDFKVKYKQSLLGPLWLFFQPLALLAAFFVAFRNLAGVETGGVPYAAFALVGLTVWAFFQAAMTIGTASVISNYHLVRLTPCPRLAFPVASLIASLPALGVTALAALIAAALAGVISPRVVLFPLGVVWLFVFTAGIVAFSSAVTVRFRDTMNALPFLLQVALFVSPVGYPAEALGPTIQTLVELNPLTGIIEAFRWMFLDVGAPDIFPLAVSALGTLAIATGGWLTFARLEVAMADDI